MRADIKIIDTIKINELYLFTSFLLHLTDKDNSFWWDYAYLWENTVNSKITAIEVKLFTKNKENKIIYHRIIKIEE